MSIRTVRSWGWILCACLGFGLVVGCARQAGPPNLLLITLDTTRRDHCSVYGYERETTPNLERVAAEGVRFALAYAPSSTTAPSHATLFTSLHPITHRVLRNGRVLLPLHETLAERFGYAQGFDRWDDEFDPATATTNRKAWQVSGVAAVDRRGDATSLDPERPIFLYRREFEPSQMEGHRVAGEKFGVRLGDFKLVLGPQEGTRELFDVLHDPRERPSWRNGSPTGSRSTSAT